MVSTTGIDTGATAARQRREPRMNAVHSGSVPPLLLLHGFPQTHAMWHQVAPELAERYSSSRPTCAATATRRRPPGGATTPTTASARWPPTRSTLMRALGPRTLRRGRPRPRRPRGAPHGARPPRRGRPAGRARHRADARTCTSASTRPSPRPTTTGSSDPAAPLPERLIGGDPIGYLRACSAAWGGGGSFAPEALAEYERGFAEADTRHATAHDGRRLHHDLQRHRADRRYRIYIADACDAVQEPFRPVEPRIGHDRTAAGRPGDAGPRR